MDLTGKKSDVADAKLSITSRHQTIELASTCVSALLLGVSIECFLSEIGSQGRRSTPTSLQSSPLSSLYATSLALAQQAVVRDLWRTLVVRRSLPHPSVRTEHTPTDLTHTPLDFPPSGAQLHLSAEPHLPTAHATAAHGHTTNQHRFCDCSSCPNIHHKCGDRVSHCHSSRRAVSPLGPIPTHNHFVIRTGCSCQSANASDPGVETFFEVLETLRSTIWYLFSLTWDSWNGNSFFHASRKLLGGNYFSVLEASGRHVFLILPNVCFVLFFWGGEQTFRGYFAHHFSQRFPATRLRKTNFRHVSAPHSSAKAELLSRRQNW